MSTPTVRKGQGPVKLTHDEFVRRLRERFADAAFEEVRDSLDRVIDVAWQTYDDYRKDLQKRKAGPGFADPEFDLPVEWLAARDAILAAQQEHDDPVRRVPHPRGLRLGAQRRHLPGRDVEDLPPVQAWPARRSKPPACRLRPPRPEPR